MNENFCNDVKNFVREIINRDELEYDDFLKTLEEAKDDLKKTLECDKYISNEKEEGTEVCIGDKTYIDIKGDSAMILENKDEFNLLIRWDNSTLEDQIKVNFGKLELGFQIYPKKEFGVTKDFIGFTLSIEGLLSCSAFPVDLNFAEEDFYLSEDFNYKFKILLVEGKEGTVKAMRVITMPSELCMIIRKSYLKIISEEYEEFDGIEDRMNMQWHIKKLGGEEAERKYGVYKIKNEVEVPKISTYINTK